MTQIMPEELLVISSMQNPKIKRLLTLQQKSSERRREGLFVVEGRRELEHCLEAGYEVENVFSLTPAPISRSLSSKGKDGIYLVTQQVYE